MPEQQYGINIEYAHKRALELIPEDFFWSCIDELAPFGSDEGDMALYEFRNWRKNNPDSQTLECLKWTIESVGDIDFEDYNESLLSVDKIKQQLEDKNFDDHQYIFTLDISVIATGFGQLVDEGTIDSENKPVIKIAINRQIIWSELQEGWPYSSDYISKLKILERALIAA